MNGVIVNYRREVTTVTFNQMILEVEGVDSKEKAQKLVGKSVVYKTEAGKEIKGKIRALHGRKGAVRALFENGMPGQSIGKKVEIQ